MMQSGRGQVKQLEEYLQGRDVTGALSFPFVRAFFRQVDTVDFPTPQAFAICVTVYPRE